MTGVESESSQRPSPRTSRAVRRRRQEEERWMVVASTQNQASEGVRWIQLDWARESIRSWWPKPKAQPKPQPGT
jgi:hypothetical protein